MTSILLLAGTSEAAELARRLAVEQPDLRVVVSFAGRTARPADLPGESRRGGFGGADALAELIRGEGHRLVVDATHPFAARMSANATAAAAAAGVPRLRVLRPAWVDRPGDRWHRVPDLGSAADEVDALALRRPFLAIGRQHATDFLATSCDRLVVRTVDPPDPPIDARFEVVVGRGPFTLADELALLREHQVDGIVARDSGGDATIAKLEAARALELPVVLVERPPPGPGPQVSTVDEAVAWVSSHLP